MVDEHPAAASTPLKSVAAFTLCHMNLFMHEFYTESKTAPFYFRNNFVEPTVF